MMRRVIDKVVDQVLTVLGLGPGFTIDLRESFYSQVNENLYLGAKPDVERAIELKEEGITHIVSCLPEADRSKMEFLQNDFCHLFLGVHDGIQQDIGSSFPPFFDYVSTAIANDRKARLFVHCEVGVSRSPTLVIAFLMKLKALSFLDAYYRVRSKRSQVLPNIGFASQLQKLEHELRPQLLEGTPSSLARYLTEVCNAPIEIDILQSALERHDHDALRVFPTLRN